MDDQKVTTNYPSQITDVTSDGPREKNQGSGFSAQFGTEPGAGDESPTGLAICSETSASNIKVASNQVGAALMRLLHEDGGAKSAAPPQYAQDLARLCDAGHSLAQWAARYMAIKVCGRSPNTVAAKARDLATFIMWFVETHGDGAGDISRWIERDTRRYLQFLASQGRKPASDQPGALHPEALCRLGARPAGWGVYALRPAGARGADALGR